MFDKIIEYSFGKFPNLPSELSGIKMLIRKDSEKYSTPTYDDLKTWSYQGEHKLTLTWNESCTLIHIPEKKQFMYTRSFSEKETTLRPEVWFCGFDETVPKKELFDSRIRHDGQWFSPPRILREEGYDGLMKALMPYTIRQLGNRLKKSKRVLRYKDVWVLPISDSFSNTLLQTVNLINNSRFAPKEIKIDSLYGTGTEFKGVSKTAFAFKLGGEGYYKIVKGKIMCWREVGLDISDGWHLVGWCSHKWIRSGFYRHGF